MKKLIYLEDAINEIARWIGYLDKDMISRIQIGLERLPSAQPEIEERMSETEQNVPNDDFISRKGAIDALMEDFKRIPTNAIRAKTVIEQLPSAQPEIEERMSETEQNVPNDDFISRKGAIDAIEAVFPVDPMKSEYAQGIACGAALSKTYIEQLPSAQPEHQWIPVTERLPEDYKDVLVYFEYYRYGDYDCMFSTYGIGSYSGEYDSWLVNSETGWHKLHVFAWMPLPEPYREEGEQE